MDGQTKAYLSNNGEYTTFTFGGRTLTFLTSKSLERYTSVKEWDNGYLVVMAKYSTRQAEEEEYIDLIPILEGYGAPIYFVGDGYSLIEGMDNASFRHTPEMLRYQNAYSVGKIAYRKLQNGEFTTDEGLRVEYLRKPQAEREREERLEREGKNE